MNRPLTLLTLSSVFLLSMAMTGCEDGGDNPQTITDDDATDTILDTSDGTDMTTDMTDSTDSGDGQTEPDPNSVDLPDPDDYMFSSEHVFSTDDIVGGFDGTVAADDPSILCTSGCEDNVQQSGSITLFPIDNGFGWNVIDYVGAEQRARDDNHEEGWAGNIMDGDEVIGLGVSNIPTLTFRTGRNQGQWCAGLGGALVKCKSNNYVTMQHVLTCAERIPYLFFDPITGMPALSEYENCEELSDSLDQDPDTLTEYEYDLDPDNIARGDDYSIVLGENIEEWKYIWGGVDKRPTDVRINAHIPVPDDFDSQEYRITRAELAIVHTVTNNPNDKVLPEGLENEGPAGRIPGYEVDEDGRWLSTVDCYEGDGDFIPAGTVLKNPDFAEPDAVTEDLQEGYTNAWYTTLDRNPFLAGEETGPRWRLQAPKFGQDLPGVEIPAENCNPGPLQKGDKLRERGDITATIINLLDPQEGAVDDEPVFSTSEGFRGTNPLQSLQNDGLTGDGLTLTDDLDLQLHIKGDRQPVRIYRAVLYLDYEPIE
jgi:hypothetical protein